jgi:hypothetical protein
MVCSEPAIDRNPLPLNGSIAEKRGAIAYNQNCQDGS